jgi:hypothetical protein
MFRQALVLLISLFAITVARAQDSTAYVRQEPAKPHIPFKDRLWFGGGLGLSFGTITAIQVDPLVGVHLDHARKLSIGLGPSYSYFQDNEYVPAYEQTAYGYRVFTRYRAIEQAYLHAEFLHLNTEPYYTFDNRTGRIWVPHILLGAGYVQPLGDVTSFYIQVLFEVLQDPNSVYIGQGPIFSVGVGVGF